MSISSYETSQKIYIDLWLDAYFPIVLFKKISTINEYENYQIKNTGNTSGKISYNTKINEWVDKSGELGVGYWDWTSGTCYWNETDELNALRRASIYLEARELYVKVKYYLSQYLLIDVIRYFLYSVMPNFYVLNNIFI